MYTVTDPDGVMIGAAADEVGSNEIVIKDVVARIRRQLPTNVSRETAVRLMEVRLREILPAYKVVLL